MLSTLVSRLPLVGVSGLAFALSSSVRTDPPERFYQVTGLTSDQAGEAPNTDPHLVNAWGIAFNPTGVWWVNDADTGFSTLYDGNGVPQSLVVSIPSADPASHGAPTGIVFYGGNNFVVSDDAGHSAPSRFIFASEDGTISGWAPAVPPPAPATVAHLAARGQTSGAIYKGLALGLSTAGDTIYATDFHNNHIDAFGPDFTPAHLAGQFRDPGVPRGFAPFGITAIKGKLYVTFAKQDADAEDDVAGPGLGFVSVFDFNGNFLRRLVTRGHLNAPWGMALAPDDFGAFSGDLLVSNFGDGRIHAYDPDNGHFRGTLRQANGRDIRIDGLWGLAFGNGSGAGPTNTLFFTSGPDDESHGLFGKIEAVARQHHHHHDDDDADRDDEQGDPTGS